MSPGRAASPARSSTLVRAPNHLGDVVMALPALAEAGHDVMVVHTLAPLVEMAELSGRVHRLERGPRGFLRAVRLLRGLDYERGVLMSAAFSAAWLFRVGGVGELRGTATDGRSFLLADPLPRAALGRRHRVLQYHFLLGQNPEREPRPLPVTPPQPELDRWRREVAHDGPVVGVFPGSNAPARRWDVERFRSLAERVAGAGGRVVALGAGSEAVLTARVTERVRGAVDAGGRTDLRELTAVLALCDVLVTNDTGPMHLAGVVGTPTLSLWGSSDPAEVRPLGARSIEVRAEPLA